VDMTVGLLSLVWRKREVRDDELGGWLIWRELGGLRWILVKFWVKRDQCCNEGGGLIKK